MNKERIGKYIKFLRERNNLTQEELAKKVPVTREAVSKWETGRRIPDIETLIILSNIFNVSIESLLSGEESNNAVVNLYKDNIKLHKKVGILLLVTILIIITFLIYYFFNNYNSFKFYNLTGGNDNFILENSVMFVSKETFYKMSPEEKLKMRQKHGIDEEKFVVLCGVNEENQREIKPILATYKSLIFSTFTNSSFSLKTIAILPSLRIFSNSSIFTLLTKPFFVANIKYLFGSLS